ncbi:hypothetical protein M3936_12565 [Sutcliffiella horikoshii]|uniref:hypothetical protein n=1 Tax=Sutcliffiella horikoshii TaxID=79883 RepID=UPI00203A4E1F|nr:hypothetical protein [Sutcliffiella horikoshii]MCM3618415.1 hypothetical protein [Sutcliffiella horikoshii]
MKRYLLVSLLLIIIVVLTFNIYNYREQNLADLLDIRQVEKIYIIAEDKDITEFELISIDEETINQLANFFNQYNVKMTTQDGWISNHGNERFELYLGFANGDIERYTFERDVVVSNRVYEVVDATIDYTWIQELERDIHPK